MSNALLDLGTGALSGAKAGFELSGGNPYATAAGGLLMGGISLFGGAEQRGLERRANKQALAMGKQDMRLKDLTIAQAMRQDKAERDAESRRKMFGEMLGRWFANRGQPQGVA